jgi:hypothetical protein
VLLVAKEEQSKTYWKTVLKGQAAKGISFKAKAWTMHAMLASLLLDFIPSQCQKSQRQGLLHNTRTLF